MIHSSRNDSAGFAQVVCEGHGNTDGQLFYRDRLVFVEHEASVAVEGKVVGKQRTKCGYKVRPAMEVNRVLRRRGPLPINPYRTAAPGL